MNENGWIEEKKFIDVVSPGETDIENYLCSNAGQGPEGFNRKCPCPCKA